MKRTTNEWELKGIFGNPKRIDDPTIYKENEKIRLAIDSKALVSFAIHLSKIS